MGLRLLLGGCSGRHLAGVAAPLCQRRSPADPDPALPDQPCPEMLPDVLSVHPPATVPPHTRRVRGLHWHHFTRQKGEKK